MGSLQYLCEIMYHEFCLHTITWWHGLCINDSLIWQDLKQLYDKVDSIRLFQLHRQICTMQQGGASITEYFSRLQSMWAEADALTPIERLKEYVLHLDYQKFLQFLFGLNESFYAARSHLLLMNPLPSGNQVFSMLAQDENQQSISSHSASLILNDTLLEPLTTLYSFTVISFGSTSNMNTTNRSKKDLLCLYCGKKGHKEEYYFRK